MTARSRRPEILAKYQRILDRNYPDHAISYAVAQELIQALEACGINVDRLAVIDDPVAEDWRGRDAADSEAPPAGAVDELRQAVRAAGAARIEAARRRFEAADQAAMRGDEDMP